MQTKLSSLGVSCFLTTLLFAEVSPDPVFTASTHNERFITAQEKLSTSTSTAETTNEHYIFSLDLLVWDTEEEGLEFAYKNHSTQNDQHLSSYEPKAKFEPAFRASLGGIFPYDQWMLSATYTYYSTHRSRTVSSSLNQAAPPGPGLITVWTYPEAFRNNNTAARFATAKNQWNLHVSFLDLALERTCNIGTQFAISPLFGARSAWIYQRYDVDYSLGNQITPSVGAPINILSSSIDMNCLSNNVGPLFGLKSSWSLIDGFSLFANFSTSLLASRFHLGRGETDLFSEGSTTYTDSVDLEEKYWTFRPQATLSLGFSFLYHFNPVSYFLNASYETELWWKQNGLLRYIDTLNTTSGGAYVSQTQGNLMFHGLTLETGIRY